MELDRKKITVAQTQLAADVAQLREIWANLQQTEIVVLRAVAAYRESLALLRQLE
jgi:hypothetical protein